MKTDFLAEESGIAGPRPESSHQIEFERVRHYPESGESVETCDVSESGVAVPANADSTALRDARWGASIRSSLMTPACTY